MNNINLINKNKQSNIFSKTEGNEWFRRNQKSLENKNGFYETEAIKRVLGCFKDSINSICEVGCGNGAKLSILCDFFNASGFGIDPSKEAIDSGAKAYSNINLKEGNAASLPFNDNEFDLIYFGFCLYLVDRGDIYQAISEADRVLKNGGFLVILDFDPKIRHKRQYHHKEGIFSYKTSYADFFLSSGHYYLVAKDSFSHKGNYFSLESDERVSISILYKEIEPY